MAAGVGVKMLFWAPLRALNAACSVSEAAVSFAQVCGGLRAPRVMYGSSGSSTFTPPPAQDPSAARRAQWPIGALPAGVLQGGFLGLSQADLLAAGGQARWPPAPAGAHPYAPQQPPRLQPQLLVVLSPAAVSPMRGVKPEAPGEHWAVAPPGTGSGGAAQAIDGEASWSLGSQVRCQLVPTWTGGVRARQLGAWAIRPGVMGGRGAWRSSCF